MLFLELKTEIYGFEQIDESDIMIELIGQYLILETQS
jgi:hypothetical protein